MAETRDVEDVRPLAKEPGLDEREAAKAGAKPAAAAPLPELAPPPPGLPERLALWVLQAGAIAVVLVAMTDRTFELDRFFVPKELVLHATAGLAGLFALRAAFRTPLTRVDAVLGAFLALSLVSAAFATNHWAAARAVALTASGLTVFWVARGLRQAGLARPLLGALAVAVAVAAATSLLQAYGLRTDFFSLNRAPGGTLGNRNFIGHLAALGFPLLLLVVLRADRRRVFVYGAVGVGLVVGTLVLTRCRAAWLGLAAALAVMLVGWLCSRSLRRDWRRLGRFVLLLAFAAGGAAAAMVLPNTLRWNSDTPYLETARDVMNYREGSGAGRLVQYRRSARMTLSHPLLGVGPGNWPVEYPGFARRGDPSMNPNEGGTTMNPWPSSDWVAVLSERGPAGLLLLLLAWALLGRDAWRRLRTAAEPSDALPALILLATMAATATAGAFDAVLLLAWPTLLFWAAVGALWSPTAVPAVNAGRWMRGAALLLLVLMAGAGAVRSAGQVGAMALYAANGPVASLEQAARLDPGNYRVRVRLAQRLRRSRAQRCAHATAAHDLFPHAALGRRLARGCD